MNAHFVVDKPGCADLVTLPSSVIFCMESQYSLYRYDMKDDAPSGYTLCCHSHPGCT